MILTGVPDHRLPALLCEQRPDPTPAVRGTVRCTGIGLCDLALTDTKVHALQAARRLERRGCLNRPISINWSGCPAGCGNHAIADIGLQGGKARVDGEVIEVYQVFAGGRAGPAAPARPRRCWTPCPPTRSGTSSSAWRAPTPPRDLVEVGREIAVELGQANGESAEQTVA